MVEFFKVAHFPLPPHLIGYSLSLLLTFALKNGVKFYEPNRRNLGTHLAFQAVASTLTIFTPGLHNVLGIIPRSMYPAFILFLRFGYMSTIFQSIIFSYHWPKEGLTGGSSEEKIDTTDQNNEMKKKGNQEYRVPRSIMNAIFSMSFSMAVINYPYTRWNQVTTRIPVAFTDLYSLSCRAIYSLHFVLILGFLFHIFFVSPFEKLIKLFLDRDNEVMGRKEKVG